MTSYKNIKIKDRTKDVKLGNVYTSGAWMTKGDKEHKEKSVSQKSGEKRILRNKIYNQNH